MIDTSNPRKVMAPKARVTNKMLKQSDDAEHAQDASSPATTTLAPEVEDLLLQLARNSGVSTVKIQANLLASLLTSIGTLRQEVSGVRQKLATAHLDLQLVTQGRCVSFGKFPKLPIELRRMIWRTAILSPKVISLEAKLRDIDDSSRCEWLPLTKNHSALRQVCHESRTEAKIHQELLLKSIRRPGGSLHTESIFFTSDVHTIFVRDNLADENTSYDMDNMITALTSKGSSPRIKRLAFPLKEWTSVYFQLGFIMDKICRHGVEEILLVIGNHGDDIHRCADVSFVAPKQPPSQLFRLATILEMKKSLKAEQPSDGSSAESLPTMGEITWEQAEAFELRRILEEQQLRIVKRKLRAKGS